MHFFRQINFYSFIDGKKMHLCILRFNRNIKLKMKVLIVNEILKVAFGVDEFPPKAVGNDVEDEVLREAAAGAH